MRLFLVAVVVNKVDVAAVESQVSITRTNQLVVGIVVRKEPKSDVLNDVVLTDVIFVVHGSLIQPAWAS